MNNADKFCTILRILKHIGLIQKVVDYDYSPTKLWTAELGAIVLGFLHIKVDLKR